MYHLKYCPVSQSTKRDNIHFGPSGHVLLKWSSCPTEVLVFVFYVAFSILYYAQSELIFVMEDKTKSSGGLLFRPWDSKQSMQHQLHLSSKQIDLKEKHHLPSDKKEKSVPKANCAMSHHYPTGKATTESANIPPPITIAQSLSHHQSQHLFSLFNYAQSNYPNPSVAQAKMTPMIPASSRCKAPFVDYPDVIQQGFNLLSTPASSQLLNFSNLFAYNLSTMSNSLFASNTNCINNLAQKNILSSMATMPEVVHFDKSMVPDSQNLRDKQKKQRPKRFQCPHCQVSFSNNGQLKGHIRIHTGKRLIFYFKTQ